MGLQFPSLDSAIADFEGFNTPGTIAQRQNNPGDLGWGQFAIEHGATGLGDKGIAVFPDAQTGTAAEDALVNYYAGQGASIQDLISAWAPPTAPGNSPEATQNYIDYVTKKLGVSPSTPVSSLSGGSSQNASIGGDFLKSLIPGGMGLVPGFSWGRIAAFLLGLLTIGAGLYLLKPVQNIVNQTIRTARQAGEIAAL